MRRAEASDVITLVEFNAAMAEETEKKSLDPEVLQRGVEAVLADPEKGHYFLAETEGRVVGALMITREFSDWRNGWFWWIQSVYVVEACRRYGVFRALYRAVLRMATNDPDVRGLRLYVDEDNGVAQRTYEALGMRKARYWMYELDLVPSTE